MLGNNMAFLNTYITHTNMKKLFVIIFYDTFSMVFYFRKKFITFSY